MLLPTDVFVALFIVENRVEGLCLKWKKMACEIVVHFSHFIKEMFDSLEHLEWVAA